MLRGGAFSHDQNDVRCAYRSYAGPGHRYYGYGFRIVVSPL